MQLFSPDLPADSTITAPFVFNGFGCTGDNQSPALGWRDAPADTKSFAVTVYDPDAPTGSGWWHWLVIDIPPSHSELPRGFSQLLHQQHAHQPSPAIRQIRNDYGQPAYGGPCPPVGDRPHRYIFTLFALKVERLDIPDEATAALAGFAIRANSIAQASLTAHFGR
ncbi:MAG: YbhB/YbcL family Raf kinase inhibitor-like protein [Alphaproteobacteria bacterium]|nr:YbhB/YbcL family Raf kinase inhibitor-like protein [Alphaproteobacteria bacterium]